MDAKRIYDIQSSLSKNEFQMLTDIFDTDDVAYLYHVCIFKDLFFFKQGNML